VSRPFPACLGAGPIAVLGSRSLPVSVLWRVFRLAAWLARSGRPVWSGGALGADSAAVAGAVSASGTVRVFLPGLVSLVGRGRPGLPWGSPRALVASLPPWSVVPFAGGVSGSFVSRLRLRSLALLSALSRLPGSSVVLFVSEAALLSSRGGSARSLRAALRLGFVPGRSLFVFSVSVSGVVRLVRQSS
jgi:hypothetical protein